MKLNQPSIVRASIVVYLRGARAGSLSVGTNAFPAGASGRWAGRGKCRSGAEALFSAAVVNEVGPQPGIALLAVAPPHRVACGGATPSGSVLCGA